MATALRISARLPAMANVLRAAQSSRPGAKTRISKAAAAGVKCLSTAQKDERGYTLEPDADGCGGWLAHRSLVDVPGSGPGEDWIDVVRRDPKDEYGASIEYVESFSPPGRLIPHPPRILVIYGSLRETSFSRKLAFECARLLEVMGCDVRTYNPRGLPVTDPTLEDHRKSSSPSSSSISLSPSLLVFFLSTKNSSAH